MNWTDEQRKTIETTGRSILVSAAAGSGKTTVLVERIKNLLINEGADIDRFLITTFTNAAAAEMKERLEKGTLDFGVLVQPEPPKNYPYVELAHKDIWGVIMRKDSPLAAQEKICAADLDGLPLIISQQALGKNELENWFGKESSALNIVATYTLIYNASLMAEEGIGYVLSLDKLLNLTENSALIFKPLSPPTVFKNFFVWKKNQVFSRAAELLQEKVKNLSSLTTT